MKRLIIPLILCAAASFSVRAAEPALVYVMPIRETIGPGAVRLTDKCLRQAADMGADYIVVDLNTYGGIVESADSIRTRFLDSKIPIYVFVNNQAVSAGALIALSADRIYMRQGATMGSATVVDGQGNVMPDKYQSFMRAVMRSTAESHGKKAVVDSQGDTSWVWVRDPLIAEAMVDPTIVVPGLDDETKVVNFTAAEAIEWGYCEGKAASVGELLSAAGIENADIYEYTPTWMDRLMGFLTNPVFQGILIMFIVGGIYFELQSPGIGFALAVAILAAALYFAPLYAEGVLKYWEIIIFVIGIILIVVEIFATPGFGVLGIGGILLTVTGLTFALIDTDLIKHIPSGAVSVGVVLRPLGLVVISLAAGFLVAIWLGRKFLTGRSPLQNRVVLNAEMTTGEGYVSHTVVGDMTGREGVTVVPLRPAGKVEIDGVRYEAAGDNGLFIEKGRRVAVVRREAGVLYCVEIGE